MAFSAADLQKRHELEGAPDPFPSLADPTPSKARATRGAPDLDTSSESAFPSLAPSAPVAPPLQSAWSNGPRLKAVTHKPVYTDSFTLSALDLSTAGKDGKPTSLGEVMKQVMAKYSVKLDASANQRTRQTTFHVKAESEKELEKAKKSLLALLSPMTSLVVNAPASTIPAIIGTKGAQLKQIRDQTGVRVDIPRKDAIAGNGQASVPASGKASPSHGGEDDDDDGPSIPITLTGPQPLVIEAQAMINEIIASRTSNLTRHVRDIEPHILPFIIARRPVFISAAQTEDISLSLNQAAREISVSGNREAVLRVVASIKAQIDHVKATLTNIKMGLPKPKHRLLVGKFTDEIFTKSKCSVVIPSYEDPSEDVIVWGLGSDLPGGLSAVMEQANSKYIHEFPLPGPASLSRQLLEYFLRNNYPKTLQESHPDVLVFTPTISAALQSTKVNVDLVGEKFAVDAVVRQVSELIGKLIGAVREVPIDWLLHRIILGKNSKKLKAFHETHNVNLYWPTESEERSTVLLVYDPFSPNASPSPDDKKKHLDDAQTELQGMARAAADVKSQTISVEKRWHEAIVGRNGTTLNAIVGEDKTLSIKFGSEIGEDATEDQVLIRGTSADVDRAVKEIYRIVENAKNDEIDNSHSIEFEIDREYVGRVVGAQGAGINKLRDQLGVKVDLFDDNEEREKEGSKKKKAPHPKSRVKITGRKENVEEAKKRILAQVDRLADETQEFLKIPSQYHASLIGQSGKYAIRLEEKYAVKITFPRNANSEGKSGDGEGKFKDQKPDEVSVKGGKKGVAQAKSELLDALEFEKESSNEISFTIPTRAVSRILGRGGAQILEIRDETNAQIDIEKVTDGNPTTNVKAKGTKKAINAAKTAILAIAEQVTEEITETLTIENRFHRTLIGAGGQGLRDLIARCGGPSDPKAQAGLIRFPRAAEPSDEARLRGEPKLVKKLKAELEKVVAGLRDRVILAVEVPSAQHRNLIGRGGQNLTEFQNRVGAQVQFPGSRSYNQVGEPENAADFADVDAANIVKVTGTRAACEVAITELKASVKPPAPEGITGTAIIPNKYYHSIIQQGQIFRTLRNHGTIVEQGQDPPKPTTPIRPVSSARIDEEESSGVVWEVVPNHQDTDDGTSTWTLKYKDQAALDKAQALIQEAIEHAQKLTHVGFLTLPDRSNFPRIVGTKGANVARLRNETGTDITVSRENNTITIVGSETSIVAAKDAILRISSTRNRSPRRRDQD